MAFVWINGTFETDSAAGVSLRDTGLLHAAGVFTTMRSYGGKVFRLAQHFQRLRASCEALFIPLQHKDDELIAVVEELLKRNELSDARLRLTVTRGAAQQDPLHGLRLEPTAFLTAAELQPYPVEYFEKGMTVVLLDEQKLNPYDIQAGHKTLNYFSRLAALREATRRGAGEALWFNVHNYLQSGSIANAFLVKDGEMITAPTPGEMLNAELSREIPYPRSAVLPGVMRQAVIDIARELGIPVRFAGANVEQLLDADEIFLTNSIMQVMPVCRIEQSAVGADRPGEMTTRLARGVEELIRKECFVG